MNEVVYSKRLDTEGSNKVMDPAGQILEGPGPCDPCGTDAYAPIARSTYTPRPHLKMRRDKNPSKARSKPDNPRKTRGITAPRAAATIVHVSPSPADTEWSADGPALSQHWPGSTVDTGQSQTLRRRHRRRFALASSRPSHAQRTTK